MSSQSEQRMLNDGYIIKERWKTISKIGGGGFGEIYEVEDMTTKERYGLKLESTKAVKQVLKMEVAVLKKLQGKPHVCSLIGCGRNDNFSYLIMTLLGRSLADLRRAAPEQKFRPKTVLRLGLQMLDAIRDVHLAGFLHRDIKPSNFAMGPPTSEHEQARVLYIFDFGLARNFLTEDGQSVRPARSVAGFRGTVRYASPAAHRNRDLGRVDDLWSLVFSLVELATGNLPWKRLRDKDQVLEEKMKHINEISSELFVSWLRPLGDNAVFYMREVIDHVKMLGYAEAPDYVFIRSQFLKCLRIASPAALEWSLSEDIESDLSSRPSSLLHINAGLPPAAPANHGLSAETGIIVSSQMPQHLTPSTKVSAYLPRSSAMVLGTISRTHTPPAMALLTADLGHSAAAISNVQYQARGATEVPADLDEEEMIPNGFGDVMEDESKINNSSSRNNQIRKSSAPSLHSKIKSADRGSFSYQQRNVGFGGSWNSSGSFNRRPRSSSHTRLSTTASQKSDASSLPPTHPSVLAQLMKPSLSQASQISSHCEPPLSVSVIPTSQSTIMLASPNPQSPPPTQSSTQTSATLMPNKLRHSKEQPLIFVPERPSNNANIKNVSPSPRPPSTHPPPPNRRALMERRLNLVPTSQQNVTQTTTESQRPNSGNNSSLSNNTSNANNR